MTAALHSYKIWEIFIEFYGEPPWDCDYCGHTVEKFGKPSLEGVVHHKNEDRLDNSKDNLAVMHSSCHGRHHNSGRTYTSETLEKMRKAQQGKKLTKDHKDKIGKSLKGREFTEGHKNRISEALKSYLKDPIARAQRSAIRKGIPLTDDQREILRKGWKEESREPTYCECGNGPFKGPRALKMHKGRWCKLINTGEVSES